MLPNVLLDDGKLIINIPLSRSNLGKIDGNLIEIYFRKFSYNGCCKIGF